MRDSVPSVRYSSICNVLRLWTGCKINGRHVAIGVINIYFVTSSFLAPFVSTYSCPDSGYGSHTYVYMAAITTLNRFIHEQC